jgi:hypothetical protein
MKRRWKFRPDLAGCSLEDRLVPAVPNFASIVLTPSGYVFLTPFPGANSSGAGTLGSNGPGGATAAAVSGAAIPSALFITGSNGLSSLRPGNITGVPSLAGGPTAGGGVSVTIQVGSGADETGGPTNNIPVAGATNNTIGLATVADPTQRPTMTIIGPTSPFSTNSPVLPPGQSYRDNAPVRPPGPYGVNAPGRSINPSINGQTTNPFAPNPQNGAPRLGPMAPNRSMTSPLPGSLMPMGPALPVNN